MSVSNGSKEPAEVRVDSESLSDLLRPLSENSESVRPFVPSLGGPRLYLLLLYASVVIGSSIEFFLSQEIWYGNWEVYNTYVFSVSGVFVLMGMLMLFATRGPVEERHWPLPVDKPTTGLIGLVLFGMGGIGLVAIGQSIGGWAALLSIMLLTGFMFMVLGSKAISSKDALWLAVYGTGVVLMTLVPVHEAFDVGRSAVGEYPFTAVNLLLLAVGMTGCLISLQFLKTKDGHLGAWLLGAMVIFLVSFHEQVGIYSTDTYERYDRGLALIGIVFSFLPLVMYVWREKEYFSIWSKLRGAHTMIESGNYKAAVEHADAALNETSAAGISHKFALPWVMKADAYYRMRQYSKAKTNYDIALEIDPDDSVSWCHMGNIQAFEGKRALALSAFDKAIRADPDNAYAWNNKGVVFNSLQWPEEAHACFARAAMIDPKSFDAQLNLGKVSAKLGRSDEAVTHYQAALALNPDSKDAAEGLRNQFLRGMCMDQIRGWEQLGMDTTYLRSLLDKDLEDFERKSKEFITSIVDQKTQLTIGMGSAKLDVNEAIKSVMTVTGETGATLDRIEKETGLPKEQLVLPMALLMKTDRLHFKRSGSHEVYVSKGRLPEKPPEPKPDEKPPELRKREKRKEHRESEFEPTASVLMFGRKKQKPA
jgi:tetratricopeptide (TPR) repeat protein